MDLTEAEDIKKRWQEYTEGDSEVTQSFPTLCNPMDCSLPAPPSMGFSRQEYWSGLPFPSPRDLPNPGIQLRYPALQADSLLSEPPRKPESTGYWPQRAEVQIKGIISLSPESCIFPYTEKH